MANTFRSQSRDHRSLVAVSMASTKRPPLSEACTNPDCPIAGQSITVFRRKVDVICDGQCGDGMS